MTLYRLGLAGHPDIVPRRYSARVDGGDHVGRTRREWHAADAEAWLVRAATIGGGRAVRSAEPRDRAAITTRWASVIGVQCAADPDVRLPDRCENTTLGSPALVAAVDACRRALPAAARHSAAAAANTAVRNEVTATRRRVRALERRWIPQLETAMGGIRLQMAELEDADAVRRRRAATMNPGRGDQP